MWRGIVILFAAFNALALGNFGGGNSAQPLPFAVYPTGNNGGAAFGDGVNQIVTGHIAADGSFTAQGIAPESFFNSFVFSLDTNSFAINNGTLYSKGLTGGGSFPSLVVTLPNLITNFPYSTNLAGNRLIMGAVPSYYGGATLGGNPSRCAAQIVGDSAPPYAPFFIQLSTDGGGTWFNAVKTNVPCLVSLWCFNAYPAFYTNLTVTSFVNPGAIGATNDLTGQTVLVSAPAQPQSAINLAAAQTVAAAALTNWANSPAIAAVNLAGNDFKLNNSWTLTSSNRALIFRAAGADVFTLTAGIFGGTGPVLNGLAKTGTNLLFRLTATAAPTIQFETNLAANAWATLAGQTNWQDVNAGFWYVAAPVPAGAQAYFRASVATTNSTPATVKFSAALDAGGVTTNLQFTFASQRTNTLYFTNGILMRVSQP